MTPNRLFVIRFVIAGSLVAVPPVFAAAQSRLPITNPDAAKPLPCSVAGMVVQLAGSAPIKSATVRLESVEDHTRTFSATTDSGGRFEVKGIDPGGYRLRVIRNGFVTQEYGQRTSNDAGAVLSLPPGRDMKDLLFRLVPSAVVSGRIENEDGDPLPWVRVSALRQVYFRGKRRLSSETTVVTNDRGEYRLFGLRPGRYFISATYKPGQRLDAASDDAGGDDAGSVGYVPTYYPASPDPAKAIVVAVKTGEEISSINLSLEPVPVYSIRGRVENIVSRQASGIALMLELRSNGIVWTNSIQQALVDKPDGTFEIRGVLRGSYTLTAVWSDHGRQYSARRAVDVGNIDVEGVLLTITPGVTVAGQVVWDPNPSLEKETLTIAVNSADSTAQHAQMIRVSPDGNFSLLGMNDGLYRITAFGQTGDVYLKSLRYGGMEVSDDEFNVIRGTQATLEVTISAKGARVQGTVTKDDGLPAVGVFVVLVPEPARRDEFHLFKVRNTDQYGRFDLRGIAPGDYKLFSWEQVQQNAWEDPEFLKDFEGKGQSVSLQENEAKQVNLVAIPTPSNEQEKP